MTSQYPKRLIEVDLPIARISAHARREKSIRHGHISTLHIWWARRPLAACRAVICASLWPDPADELCPGAFRAAAVEQIKQFAARVFPKKVTEEGRLLASEKHCSPESRARWEAIAGGTLTLDANQPADMPLLRLCLLDFIADFANWDNSTVPAYLETSRALTQAAHEALGGVPGTRPLVVDPFAGGGSIPLEALRVGADAFASDLNPVAVLLNKVVLEYIPKYGQRLAEEVRKWGQWVKGEAEKELAQFYPKDEDGSTPIAYLWARTIRSEAPDQEGLPVEVPLIRSMWIAKKSGRRVALRWRRDSHGHICTKIVGRHAADGTITRVRSPQFEIFEPQRDSEVPDGTVARGSATCPITGYTTSAPSVKRQLQARRGGAADARLLAVAVMRPGEWKRTYRLETDADYEVLVRVATAFKELEGKCNSDGVSLLPIEKAPVGGGSGAGRGLSHSGYAMNLIVDMHTPRQAVVLATIARIIHDVAECPPEVKTLLALALGRTQDLSGALATWANTLEAVCGANRAQNRMPIVWDFVEAVPIAGAGGDYVGQIDWVARVAEHCSASNYPTGNVARTKAQNQTLPDEFADAFITDPPYYDAFAYADLSAFFFAWLRRAVPAEVLQFSEDVPPQEDEIVLYGRGTPGFRVTYDEAYFHREMAKAMSESRRVAKPGAISTVVFANKTTEGWEALLQSLIDAGWILTASWPIDTERPNRQRAQSAAALTSSVHLVCRPRENEDGTLREEVGEWRDVLSELPRRIHEWMPRLAAEGVVGADAIFACLGPALEIFSRYSRVEKASGEAVPLREYLEQVWAAVSTEALSMIFRDADAAGLEPDARLTAMWLWTLGAGTGKAGGNGKAIPIVPGLATDDEDETPLPSKPVESSGYTLEYDAARKIAQGLGIHLEQSDTIVEVKGDKARLLPVSERTRHLFGKAEGGIPNAGKKKKTPAKQKSLFDQIEQLEAEAETEPGELKPTAGETVLDRVHQAMILFAAGRGEALRRFLVDDGAGKDARFWKLAQSLSALYPKETDEKRWVDGVLARKKGLGL